MCKVSWCNRTNMRGKDICRYHYEMIRQHGRIIDKRTPYDDNRIIMHDGYAEMIITDSKDNETGRVKIDVEDIERLSGRHWSENGNGYVRSFIKTSPVYLHRFILGYHGRMDVDHINGDKSDNRKSNLRIVSHSVNALNKRNASCVHKITGRVLKKPYLASVFFNGSYALYKYFATEEEAKSAVIETKKSLNVW